MGNILRDLCTGAALLVCALIVAILLIPVLVFLSVALHLISWFLSALLSILLLAFVVWGIGFLYRRAREEGKAR
ncbi:MAG TPA: hypothetical protein DCR97_06640 [Deltaproteobacteria bacterium]|nr:hypothetical protein [Deltaproteobacteria bacterium]